MLQLSVNNLNNSKSVSLLRSSQPQLWIDRRCWTNNSNNNTSNSGNSNSEKDSNSSEKKLLGHSNSSDNEYAYIDRQKLSTFSAAAAAAASASVYDPLVGRNGGGGGRLSKSGYGLSSAEPEPYATTDIVRSQQRQMFTQKQGNYGKSVQASIEISFSFLLTFVHKTNTMTA